ncbi:sugar nucleotide-binding protein [Microbispora sp. NBC_01389]|uniref:sugar nucleotide-binding protein n=1 Tax=Microbispora sp. NBC_01389 TaxID=2903584 RepID=UPI00386C72A9
MGGSGLLGGEVVRQATTDGHVVAATYLTRPETATGVEWLPLDVRDRAAVIGLIGAFGPGVVVNAAYRQPDWETTAVGAAHVAVAASGNGGRLVHVSSDAVFSGEAITYAEDSVPDPVTPYGAAKAAAEVAVQAIDPTAVIVRTSLIIGDGGSAHEGMVHALCVPGPIDVRLDCRHTQRYLTTRLRGAREFLK